MGGMDFCGFILAVRIAGDVEYLSQTTPQCRVVCNPLESYVGCSGIMALGVERRLPGGGRSGYSLYSLSFRHRVVRGMSKSLAAMPLL